MGLSWRWLWAVSIHSHTEIKMINKIYIKKKAEEELAGFTKLKENIEKDLDENLGKDPQRELDEFFPKDENYWTQYNRAKCSEKRMFYLLLDELLQLVEEPKHIQGRRPISVRDMIFCSCLKLYNGLAGRTISSDLVHAKEAGYIDRVPHFNTLLTFMNNKFTEELLTKLITISAMPLKELETDFAVDASGFGCYQFERWMKVRFPKEEDKKTATRLWRNYVKLHICCGTRTNVITSAKVTVGNSGDNPEFPELVKNTSANFDAKRYSADKAYSCKKNMQLIASLEAIPYIVFKSNATDKDKKAPIWCYMFNHFKNNEKSFGKYYHRRSNVETVFSMIKLRLGEFLKCKNLQSQKNEVLLKCLSHNICCLVQQIFQSKIKIDFPFCDKNYSCT